MNVFSQNILFKNTGLLQQWAAQVMAQGSFRAFQISVIWWINTNAHSYFGAGVLLALFLIASALPSILLAKPIGRYIDRKNPVSTLSRSALIGSGILLVATGISSVGFFSHYFAIAVGALLALVHALFDPCLQKNLGHVVDSQDVDSAVALVTSTQSIVNFGGAVAGAFLISSLSLPSIFAIGSALYFMSFAFLFLRADSSSASSKTIDSQGSVTPSTFKWDPVLFKMVIGFGFINFFLTPIVIILSLYVQKILRGTAVDLALLEASISIGLILGMIVGQKLTRSYSVLSTAAIAMAVTGGALFLPGFFMHRFVYLPLLFIAGFAVGCNNVKVISHFQLVIPQENKGQFFSYLQAAISFAVPIGYLIFGSLGDLLSPHVLCLIQGFGIVSLSLYFLWIGKRHEVAV